MHISASFRAFLKNKSHIYQWLDKKIVPEYTLNPAKPSFKKTQKRRPNLMVKNRNLAGNILQKTLFYFCHVSVMVRINMRTTSQAAGFALWAS
jgi:hypothetical protein